MTPFEALYQRLNTEQKLAVDTLEGPVMVLAGPGTGKTQILSARIAAILQKTDVRPHNILALTFTNAGAKTLQQRLVSLIGAPGYAVKTSTFHSFCSEVISEHGEYFPVARVSRDPVSEVEKFSILEEIFRENDFPELKNPKNPLQYLRDILSLISDYKREGHTPLTLQRLAQEERESLDSEELPAAKKRTRERLIIKNLELAQVYAEYQRHLRDRNVFDFEDVILWVRDALRENEDLRLEYQERYQYFLIDEFQDTNEAQLQVVRELSSYWGDQANVFVVGDPNQSIYRFQGASLANTLSFLDHYPQAAVISLTTGYRCGDEIYQAASELISNNGLTSSDERLESLHRPLKNFSQAHASLLVQRASSPVAEMLWVSREIEALHAKGVAYSEMAVLYHKHANAQILEEILQREEVPFQKAVSLNLLDNHLVQQVLTLLRFLVEVKSKRELSEMIGLLHLPWLELDPNDTLLLLREGSSSAVHSKNPWIFLQDDDALSKEVWKDVERLKAVRSLLVLLQQREAAEPFPEFIETVLRETGFYHFYTGKRPLPVEDLSAISSFLRIVQSWYGRDTRRGVREFLQELDTMREHGITLTQESLGLQREAVELSTVHNAKGKEWEYVFIVRAQDTIWGNVKRQNKLSPLAGTIPYADLSKNERDEDERRLFYVALTRAKKQVAVSLSEREVAQDRMKELLPTQFLTEIQQPFLETETISPEDLQQEMRVWLQQRTSKHPALEIERAWLLQLVDDFCLSFSALQDLKTCPTAFLYKRILRLPELPKPALALGTAVHAALEYLYRDLNQNGSVPNQESLFRRAEDVVGRFAFPDDQLLALQAKAKTIVSEYYQEHHSDFRPSLFVERYFGNTPPLLFEGLPLIGKVDRMDLIDSVAKTVCVVDYKTGQERSRNHIEGKIPSSDGMMFKQLVFYKLLADLDPTFEYSVNEGKFVFVEKTKSGKFREEKFSLTDLDVDTLKDELRQVHTDLQNLTFLDAQPCGKCDVCTVLGLSASVLESQAEILIQQEI